MTPITPSPIADGAVAGPANTDVHSCGYHCILPQCIEAQRDELREDLRTALDDLTIEATECIALRQRIAELEQDAARYRWLRSPSAIQVSDLLNKCNEAFDAAIDAAMKG